MGIGAYEQKQVPERTPRVARCRVMPVHGFEPTAAAIEGGHIRAGQHLEAGEAAGAIDEIARRAGLQTAAGANASR